MDSLRKEQIYQRVSVEFNVRSFKKYYYCHKIEYDDFIKRMTSLYGEGAEFYFRTDHIVLRKADGSIVVFLLSLHQKCKRFIHSGRASCLDYKF